MKAIHLASAEGRLRIRRRHDRSGVAPATRTNYESALRRMRADLGVEPSTDALLAKHVRRTLRRGFSTHYAMFKIRVAVWWAKRNGLESTYGPLTKAALLTGAKD